MKYLCIKCSNWTRYILSLLLLTKNKHLIINYNYLAQNSKPEYLELEGAGYHDEVADEEDDVHQAKKRQQMMEKVIH